MHLRSLSIAAERTLKEITISCRVFIHYCLPR